MFNFWRKPATAQAPAFVVGAISTTPRQRIEKRLHVYRLALEQNEKGRGRARVLQAYIRDHELRLEAVVKAEEAAQARAAAESAKLRGA